VRQAKTRSTRTVRHKSARNSNAQFTSRSVPIVFASLFILAVIGAVVSNRLPAIVLAIYAGASFVTLIAYALDKSAARNNRQRIAESTLHLMAVVGGWPGAVFAQHLFRHKSIKAEFRRAFWVTVVVNCAALAYLLTTRPAH
jgi:uncharacterized membrane protein YsdA (DUF1294 family)